MKRSFGRVLTAAVSAVLVGLVACSPVAQPEAGPSASPAVTTSRSTDVGPSCTTSGPASPSPSVPESLPGTASPSASETPSTAAPTPSPTSTPSATTTRPSPPTQPPTTATKPPATTAKPPASTTKPPAGPTCTIPDELLGKDLEAIPTTRRVIALTFDAGSIDKGADKILTTLDAEGVPATFFLTGRFAEKYPETARRIADAHLIGNHTQTHPDLTTLSDAEVRTELATARDAIIEATGKDPKPYFRFPYGEVDDRRIRIVNEECYVPFRWTTDTLGWQGTSGGRSVESVTKRVLDGAKPGGIVLMHIGTNPDDGSTLDTDALPGIIEGLRAKGYDFVSLAETGLSS